MSDQCILFVVRAKQCHITHCYSYVSHGASLRLPRFAPSLFDSKFCVPLFAFKSRIREFFLPYLVFHLSLFSPFYFFMYFMYLGSPYITRVLWSCKRRLYIPRKRMQQTYVLPDTCNRSACYQTCNRSACYQILETDHNELLNTCNRSACYQILVTL